MGYIGEIWDILGDVLRVKLYLFYNDYETSCSLAPMFAFGWSSCGRKPECPEETNLSDLVTTSALTLRQPVSLNLND